MINFCIMAQKRKRYNPEFKLKVALEALQEKETVSVLASKYSIHSTQINQWKKQLKEQLKDFFSTSKPAPQEDSKLVAQLYQKVGQQALELEWLKKKYEKYQRKTGLNG